MPDPQVLIPILRQALKHLLTEIDATPAGPRRDALQKAKLYLHSAMDALEVLPD